MAVNAMSFMVAQATIEPAPTVANRSQAELVAEIARRMGGVTYGGLLMEIGLARTTIERYVRLAVAEGLVRVVHRGPRQIRWIEAI